MGLFEPKQSAIERNFGIVDMEQLQRLDSFAFHGGEIAAITSELHGVLFEVANRLPGDTVRVKFDDAFNGLDPEQKEMLIRLGALERVVKHGLSGKGRKEPFDDDHRALAVQSLAKATDVTRLVNGNPSGAYATLEVEMRERLDKALDTLARRVSMRGREKKNGNDWTCFTLEDRQALLATVALEDALAKGRPGFVQRNWGKGVVAGTFAAALGGFAVTHTYPEETDAVRAAFNEAVEPVIRKVSPEAADLYQGYNLIPTEPQAEQWLRANLPQLADLIVGAPEGAPEQVNP